MKAAKVGVIGCGAISSAYFSMCPIFESLEMYACADLMMERAQEKAKEYNIPKVCTVDELLADPEIEIVINLTIPKAHFDIALAAVQAGKSVWNEKPLTISREEGQTLLQAAEAKDVLVGSAPDTFMGGSHQTCRKLLDQGIIGTPVAATAFMTCHGHESWHPAPEFYYKVGGGPMFDMGPYYLTALVNLLGPVRRVTGSTRITFPTRTITSQPLNGTVVSVDVPTHIAGVMDFANGAIGTIITSFDVWSADLPRIEIYGTEGTMSVPDPNGSGGAVRVRKAGVGEWTEYPLEFGYAKTSRSIGVADMAYALRSGRPHRASGKLAYHILDIMHAFHDASDEGRHIELTSQCERPALLPEGLPEGILDA
ncbi:MAG: Gfo/Idh/MocA family protein [Armatimonadota bacterium]